MVNKSGLVVGIRACVEQVVTHTVLTNLFIGVKKPVVTSLNKHRG